MKKKKEKEKKEKAKPAKDVWLRKTKRLYFLTSAGVYIGIFIVAYLVLSLLMTVLQTHPYVNLLMAVILLLADIFVTDRIVNKMMNDRWILTAEKKNTPAGL